MKLKQLVGLPLETLLEVGTADDPREEIGFEPDNKNQWRSILTLGEDKFRLYFDLRNYKNENVVHCGFETWDKLKQEWTEERVSTDHAFRIFGNMISEVINVIQKFNITLVIFAAKKYTIKNGKRIEFPDYEQRKEVYDNYHHIAARRIGWTRFQPRNHNGGAAYPIASKDSNITQQMINDIIDYYSDNM